MPARSMVASWIKASGMKTTKASKAAKLTWSSSCWRKWPGSLATQDPERSAAEVNQAVQARVLQIKAPRRTSGVFRSNRRLLVRKMLMPASRKAKVPAGIGRRASKRNPTPVAKSTACQRLRRRQGATIAAPETKSTKLWEAKASEARSANQRQGKVASRRMNQVQNMLSGVHRGASAPGLPAAVRRPTGTWGPRPSLPARRRGRGSATGRPP